MRGIGIDTVDEDGELTADLGAAYGIRGRAQLDQPARQFLAVATRLDPGRMLRVLKFDAGIVERAPRKPSRRTSASMASSTSPSACTGSPTAA